MSRVISTVDVIASALTLTTAETLIPAYAFVPARSLRTSGALEWELSGSSTLNGSGSTDTMTFILYYGLPGSAGTAILTASKPPTFALTAADLGGGAIWSLSTYIGVASTSTTNTLFQSRSVLTWHASSTDGVATNGSQQQSMATNVAFNATADTYFWWTVKLGALSPSGSLNPRASLVRLTTNQ